MSFYAFSPLAMGMLAGGPEKESVEAAAKLPPGSRFHPESRKGMVFRRNWFKPQIFEAVKLLNRMSAESGISQTDLSMRWIVHHSALKPELGDGLILGASSVQQLKETVASLRGGPLGEKEVKGFEEMWEIASKAT